MDSKEEIIRDKINFLLPDIATVRMAIRGAMDQYAKQEAIKFANWITDSSYVETSIDQWTDYGKDKPAITTEQLYNLYNQQKAK